MATGFPVKNNYATGDVLTAANMNDLSGTLNYLQYAKTSNGVLNSNFSVWQRGTSFALANTSSNYTADRWLGVSATTGTISRQATSDTTNLPNIQYCARAQRTNGQTGTSAIGLYQLFESVNAIPLAGKAVTLSFYARAGANYSSASNALAANLYTGTGTDQNPFVSYTGSTNPLGGTATLTTTWQRFTFTGTLAATATELYLSFTYTPSGTAGAADYFEITGVQLELGSVANTYMPNQPTYQGELAACRRYLPAFGGPNYETLLGVANSTTGCTFQVNFDVEARVQPTGITVSNGAADFRIYNAAGASGLTSAVAFSAGGKHTGQITTTTTAGSPTLTVGQAMQLLILNSGYILFTGCEL